MQSQFWLLYLFISKYSYQLLFQITFSTIAWTDWSRKCNARALWYSIFCLVFRNNNGKSFQRKKNNLFLFLFFSMNYPQDIIPSQNGNPPLICYKELSKDLHWNWQLIVFLIIVKTLLIYGNIILTYSVYFIWSFFF